MSPMTEKFKYFRDLKWMINSGPLLAGFPGLFTPDQIQRFSAEEEQWLQLVCHEPDELNEFMKPAENEILGKMYERLFLFWMSHSPNFKLIANNVQIQSGGKTATEVDVIAEHIPTSTIYHIEVSCKYYLGFQNSSEHKNWVGPNGSDNLASRLHRMTQQLSVFQTHAGHDLLKKLGIDKITSRGWLKGFLFLPYDQLTSHATPFGASKTFQAGWYMKDNETDAIDGHSAQWLSLPRTEWISPFEGSPHWNTAMDGHQLRQYVQEHFIRSKRALMLIQTDKEGRELTRGFIVHRQWPEPASE